MRKLEVKGDTVGIYFLICLSVDTYILGILGIKGMSLGRNLDVFQLHTVGAVDDDALLGIVYFQVSDADVLHWHLWKAIEVGGTACATADDVVDIDIAEGWSGFIYLLYIYHLLLLLVAVV